jgi:ribosomal subunit interface protein
MSMNIKSTNFNMGDSVKNYLDEKLNRLRKFVDLETPNTNLDIEIGKTTAHHQKGDIFRTELNLTIGGEYYRAEEESESLESSIDLAIDDLLKQLRRGKGKKETLFKKGGRSIKETFRNLF